VTGNDEGAMEWTEAEEERGFTLTKVTSPRDKGPPPGRLVDATKLMWQRTDTADG
jgi:hypothetical protein